MLLTRAELDRYMLQIALLSQLPDTDADFDDPDDEPIAINGEPLSLWVGAGQAIACKALTRPDQFGSP
jgi:hypothetical protein